MKTQCPNCGKLLDVPEQARREVVRCPACSAEFVAHPMPAALAETPLTPGAPAEPVPFPVRMELDPPSRSPEPLPQTSPFTWDTLGAGNLAGTTPTPPRGDRVTAIVWLVAALSAFAAACLFIVGLTVLNRGKPAAPPKVAEVLPARPPELPPPDRALRPEPPLQRVVDRVAPGPAPEPRDGDGARKVRPAKAIDLSGVFVTAGDALPCICWAGDARSFFTLDEQGTLCRVTLGDFREVRRLETRRKANWLSTSAEGLVLTFGEAREVWVVDPGPLTVKRRFYVSAVRRAVSASPLAVAFVWHGENRLLTLDLRTGDQRDYDGDRRRGGFTVPIISPDGKQLFGLDPNSSLFRYEVAGTRLLPGGVGYGQNKRSDAIWVSPDGAYVCVTGVGWSNWQLPEHPPNRAFPAVYVYPVNDLLHPKYTLEHAEPLAAVGFDPREPRIYAADRGSALIVYSTLGPGRHEYVFDQAYFGQGELAGRRQVLVHPDGRKMLLHTGTYFLWIEQPLP